MSPSPLRPLLKKSSLAPLLISKFVKTPVGVHSDTPALVRSGWSHFFRLRLCTCSKILGSDSCSDSSCNHRSNRNLPMWPHRLLLLPKLKSDSRSGSGFSQIFDFGLGSGSERKTQNPSGVDSENPDPVPTLAPVHHWTLPCKGVHGLDLGFFGSRPRLLPTEPGVRFSFL